MCTRSSSIGSSRNSTVVRLSEKQVDHIVHLGKLENISGQERPVPEKGQGYQKTGQSFDDSHLGCWWLSLRGELWRPRETTLGLDDVPMARNKTSPHSQFFKLSWPYVSLDDYRKVGEATHVTVS